jgi:5-methylcytosine-specific restriction endonuclease McrA
MESALPPALFMLRTEIDEETHDDIRAIQDLLGHAVPTGEMKQVVKRMAKFYRAHLEKKRFGASRAARPSTRQRHVSAQVKNAVWKRDGGQCTFVSDGGQRCGSRRLLELDHIEPVALGGRATVENMRLRCWAHNQLEAERVFGAEFMQRKRSSATAAPGRAPPG